MITVTTPATKFNLIDVSTARSALSITDNSDDAALTAFVNRASDVIARHCRRTFALETVTEQFRPDKYLGELILSRYPVIEITSITEGADALANTDYEVANDSGIVSRLYGDRPCHWSRHKITVVYSAGFDLPTSAPDALQHACVQLVKSYYMSADRDPMVRSEMSDNISSASYFGGSDHLPPDVRGLLVQFRNFRTR
ncbi:phage head-tail connector protein [Bradyrhizobium sp. 6(2017)]|uniref:phage head-tail connector protein n=1 Tax=Bradyrhizobium sp. 6(2017) TaxID=1197460 RepID=UPI0013E1A12C|nr:phage head-tail connector protein [Bradyrhizobium sp. 6(2017)]QIG92882.1 hypothetical protein G6P99_10430 [Bradyrhizobium sp. 6(2017)]